MDERNLFDWQSGDLIEEGKMNLINKSIRDIWIQLDELSTETGEISIEALQVKYEVEHNNSLYFNVQDFLDYVSGKLLNLDKKDTELLETIKNKKVTVDEIEYKTETYVTLKDFLDSIQAILQEMSDEMDLTIETVNDMNKKVIDVTEGFNEVETEVISVKNSIKLVNSTIDLIKADMEALQNEKIDISEISYVNGTYITLKSFLDYVGSKLNSLDSKDTELNNAITVLRNAITTLQNKKYNATDIAFTHETYTTVDTFVRYLERTLDDIGTDIEEIKETLEKIGEEIDIDVYTIKYTKRDCITLGNYLDFIDVTIDDLYDNIDTINLDLDTKVDKEEGKSLISDTEIERLSNVNNYDDTEVRGLIDTKSDIAYVDEKVEEINTTIDTKADKTYVDTELDKKADITYVDEQIENIDFSDYATKEEVDSALDTKVDKEEGKSLISDTEIERLSNVNNYDDTEVRGLINELEESKADKSYVEEKIGDIDFSDYVTNEELADELQTLHTHDNKEILDNITQEDVDLWTEGGNIDLSAYQTVEDNTLETDDKTIPGAINEINEFAIILERDGANDLEVFEGYPDLATDDKTIIGAINELDSRLDNISEVVDEQLSSSLIDHIQYQHPSVNSTDELDTINTKKLVDGTLAFVKEENAYYYFTKSDGWQILKTGGTGDGGGSTSAYISSTDAENLTVSTGEDLELHLDFSSPNAGRGTLKIFINDVNSLNVSLAQGETTTVIDGELFSKGNNTLTVYVLDRVGSMSNSLTFYVRYGGTEITTDFDSNASYDYGAVVRFYFVASALDTSQLLSFYMKIDGTLQGSVSCSSDVRSYYTFPNTLSVGSHYCEAWVEDESGTKSNPLTFNLVILDNSSLVVSAEEKTATVEEGSQLSLAYKVYMKNNFSFITKTYIDGNLVNTGTCTLETAYYKTSSLTEGVHTIKVEVWDTTETVSDYVTWTVTVTGSTYEMLTPITAGSTFMASAMNKSNTDENNSVWIGTNQDNQEIQATLHNFAFNSESGWMDDNLIISGESYVDVPIAPLSENAKYGFTLDIEFSSKQIGVEDAQVLTLWNDTDDCGIKITTEQLIIRSKSGKQCALYFTDDENTSAMFIIDRNEGFAKIYINGVMCEAFALSDYEVGGVDYLEDFTVSSNIKLGGSGYCRIKNLRVYQIALTTDEILNNFMANETDKTKQKELVEFQKGDTLPTLTIYGDFSGLGKDDKKPCDIVYLSPDVNKYGESFSLLGKYSQLQYQGTSSMAYPIKNYRINPRDKNGKVKINPFSAEGGQAESRFTLKADFMSSGHWQNTGLARWVSKNLYNYNSNNEGSMNPMRWHLLQNDEDVKTVRDSINGFPCRLILVNDGTSPLAEGQQEPTPGNTKDMGIFNFNNDKDNVATMGLDTDIFPNALSFEVTANSDTSAGAFVPYAEGSNYVFPCYDRKNTYLSVCPIKKAPYVGQEIRITDIKGASSVTVYDGHQNGNYGGCIGGDSRYADDFSFICPSNTDFLYMLFYVYVSNAPNEPFEEVVSDVSFKLNGIPVEVKWQGSISAYDEFPRNESENAELEYLQNSFELRYPDADDYGEDYGYLGISTPQLHLHVKGDSTYFIPVEHLESKTFSIDFERAENQFLHMIGKRADGTTFTEYSKTPTGTTTIADNVTHIRFYGLGSHNTYLKIGNITYLLERTENPIIEEDPFYSYALDSNYGLKRVIDWVGNCTDEEFLADYEKYFNKHYLLRYYILVITLG